MEYAISALWIALELAAVFTLSSSFLNVKSSAHTIYICVLSWFIIYSGNYLSVTKALMPYLTYAVIYFMLRLIFDGKWHVLLFWEAISILLVLIIDAALYYGVSAIMGISLAELTWRKFTYTMIGTLSKLLVLFCSWILYRARNRRLIPGGQGKWFFLTILFPMLSIVIIVLNHTNNSNTSDVSGGIFLISLILALANIGIVYLVNSLERSTVREQEMALLNQQMAHQTENYKALEKSYSEQRKASHEFERHIHMLSSLLDQEQFETAQRYMRNLKKSGVHRDSRVNCKHPVIDVILNQKYRVSQEKSIKMDIQINDLSAVMIREDLLVVLLSNLLDNAIEASESTEGKEIFCRILHNDGLFISVRNTSAPVTIVENNIIAGKPVGIEHGYGIPAIKYVLEQLHAEYFFSYDNGWFQFVAEIPEQ